MSRILIAGNSDEYQTRLKDKLHQAGFEVYVCMNAGELMEILADTEIDVIVVSRTLSKTPWLEINQSVMAAAPGVQVIILSSEPDFELAHIAFQNSVFDYMDCSANIDSVIRSVTNAARFKNLNAERHELLEDSSRYFGRLDEILQHKESEFNASESRWRTLVDAIPDLVWLKDNEGKYLACNTKYEQFIGAEESEIIGKTDNAFENELRAAIFHQQDNATFDSEAMTINEVVVKFANDGHTEVLETVKVPMNMPDGSKIGVLGIGRNVTRRKELQSLTKIQALRAEALLELPKVGENLDENALLTRGLSIIEKNTQSRLSFFCFVDHKNENLDLVACSDQAAEGSGTVSTGLSVPFANAGVWAEMLRNHQPILINDCQVNEFDGWMLAGPTSCGRIIGIPVVENGRVVMLAGALNKEEEYSQTDLDTLQLITIELWRLIERDRSEKAVSRFSRVLERSQNEIYIFDSDSLKFTDVNKGARDNLGYSAEELYAMTPLDIKPYMTPESFDELLEPLRSGQSKEIKFSSLHGRKDQTKYAVEITIELMDEHPPVFVALAQDIGERVRMEDELRKLAQAVEQSPEGIVITNEKAEIEYINESFIESCGYSREELIGRNPSIKQSGKTPAETYRQMWDALQNGLPWQGELYNQRKDGTEYTEMAHLAPIKQPDGTVTHYLGVLEDITEKMKLTEELDQHRNHLEHLVEERTELLVEAQKQAESANQAKSAFLAMMSHEIRTPINAIVGLTHLLKRSNPSPQQSKQLGKIETSAEFLMSIINDILDLSKIEAGKLKLEESEFHLDVIFDHLRSLMTEQARSKGLNLEFDHHEVPIWIKGDATRLRHALLNYINNAIKFSDSGTVSVRVQLLEDYGNKLMLRFEVKDNGIGIDPERIPVLFDDFEQADASTTRKFGGTGLGLAITLRLAKLMGGDAGATSQLGTGSTFWFTALVQRGSGRHPEVEKTDSSNAENNLREKHSGSRVLLVEDNAINSEVALALLKEAGLEVDSAKNGLEAVEMTSESDYDLILMDLQMPEMDGLEATRLIRANSQYGQIPILAMTANVFSEDRQACREAGMNDFVAKPVEPQNLFFTINKWLDDNTQTAGEQPAPDLYIEAVDGEFSALINPKALDKIFGNDTSAKTNLLQTFISQSTDIVSKIDDGYELREAEKISFQAHKLKSSARTVGADGLADLCLALELAGRENRWSDIDHLVPKLGPLVEQIQVHLTD